MAVEIGKNDPNPAVTLLKQLANPLAQGGPGNKLLGEMIRKDPAVAIAWVGEHFESYTSSGNWVSVVLVQSLWNAEAPEVIAGIADTADDLLRNKLIAGLREYTTNRDLSRLLASVDSLPPGEMRDQFRESLFTPLVRSDVKAAQLYLESLPEGEATDAIWEEAVRWSRGTGLIEAAPQVIQDKFAGRQLAELAAGEPETALRKLDAFRKRSDYAELASVIAASWPRQDPEGAMAWIETLPPEAIGASASRFAANAGADNAPATLAWVQSLSGVDSDELFKVASSITYRWTARDGIAASAAIRDLPDGATRQGAINGLVEATFETDSEAALEWVDQMEDASARESFRERIVKFEEMHSRRSPE